MKHTIDDVKTVNPEFRMYHNRIGLFNSHFQNFKQFGVPKAQLILTDIPYNIGKNAYGSNPVWYVGGDNKNGESDLAGEEFFDTDKDFRPAESQQMERRRQAMYDTRTLFDVNETKEDEK